MCSKDRRFGLKLICSPWLVLVSVVPPLMEMEMDPSIRMLQLSQQSCHCPASPGCLATHLPCLSRNAGRILQRHWSIPVLSVLSSTAHLCSARAWQSPVTFSSDILSLQGHLSHSCLTALRGAACLLACSCCLVWQNSVIFASL